MQTGLPYVDSRSNAGVAFDESVVRLLIGISNAFVGERIHPAAKLGISG
jgi:hypothetical protein